MCVLEGLGVFELLTGGAEDRLDGVFTDAHEEVGEHFEDKLDFLGGRLFEVVELEGDAELGDAVEDIGLFDHEVVVDIGGLVLLFALFGGGGGGLLVLG